MTNPLRRKQITRTVLETLSMAGGYALEESRMWSFVNDLVKPPLQFTEQGVVAAYLKEAGMIRLAKDDTDPGLKQWIITDLGKNHLAGL